MYCPQCGTESTAALPYCRLCGANLKVIGKAVSLSEAIARSDRGPVPKIKEMMKNLHPEQVTEEISQALDQMNTEIAKSSPDPAQPKGRWFRKKTAAERREKHITTGVVSLFAGTGLTLFLYFLSAALILKLPPDVVARIPFEIDPVAHTLWAIGLMPIFSGVGHIIAGLLIRSDTTEAPTLSTYSPPEIAAEPESLTQPMSVTERTTNILKHRVGD
jgi:hypothetical protein